MKEEECAVHTNVLMTNHVHLLATPSRGGQIGATAGERQLAYRRLFDTPAAPDEVNTIRQYLQRQHALGSSRFKDAIERQLARRVGPAKVGRPRTLQSTETAL